MFVRVYVCVCVCVCVSLCKNIQLAKIREEWGASFSSWHLEVSVQGALE